MRSHKALTLVSLERLNVQNITSVVLPLICSLKWANDFVCSQLICRLFFSINQLGFWFKECQKVEKRYRSFFPQVQDYVLKHCILSTTQRYSAAALKVERYQKI